MKFLLEIVSCCGSNNSRQKVSGKNPPLVEETRSLVPAAPPSSRRSSQRYRSRKRGRVSSSRSGSSVEWRPSLSAISEEKDDRTAVRSENRQEEGCSDSLSSRQKLQRRFRQEAPSTIIPTFSPTPFLF